MSHRTTASKSTSSTSTSKRRDLVELKVAKMSKELEQKMQREERAARRSLEAAKRDADKALKEARRAQEEAELMAERIEHELSMKRMEREIELAEAKVKAWDEISRTRSDKSASLKQEDIKSEVKEEDRGRFELHPTRVMLEAEEPTCSNAPPNVNPFVATQSRYNPTVDYPPPRPEILIFNGDPLQYPSFVASFQTHILNRIESGNARLTYLIQHCKPNIRSQIEHFVGIPYGFKRAWEKLYHDYGRPLVVANRCEEKLLACPKLKAKDGEGLRNMATTMEKAMVQLDGIESYSSLNSLGTLQKVVEKLPDRMQEKWVECSFNLTEETKREVTFRDLVRFVQREAAMSNSVFGKARWNASSKLELSTQSRYSSRSTTSASVVTSKPKPTAVCLLCELNHHLSKCKKFAELRHYKRVEFVKVNRLCFRCLNGGHIAENCNAKEACSIEGCTKPNHHTLLHKSNSQNTENETVTTAIHSIDSIKKPMLPLLPVKVRRGSVTVTTQALLDTGSQQTFCTHKLADQLKAPGVERSLHIKTMSNDGAPALLSGKVVSFYVSSLNGGPEIELSRVLAVKQLPVAKQFNPTYPELSRWKHLEDLQIFYPSDQEVGLLIGIDHKSAFTPLDCRVGPSEAPDAIKTPLGWMLYGNISHQDLEDTDSQIENVTSLLVSVNQLKDGPHILDPDVHVIDCGLASKNSQEDRISFQRMKDEVKMVDGHVQLPLLWRDKRSTLPDNKNLVESRLNSLKRRLLKDESLRKKYSEVMTSYFEDGYAEEINSEEASQGRVKWYLPHQPVVNPQKPDKLRIVFDCRAECKGLSLNKALMQGPDLTNSLVGVLTRFRQEPVAVIADIKSMFHQVKVDPADGDALRFLWWPQGDLSAKPVECRMMVHLFGATSSPSAAAFALRYATEVFKEDYSQKALEVVLNNFYVDDMLMSAATANEALKLAREVKDMLSKAGFELAKWTSNDNNVLGSISSSENPIKFKTISGCATGKQSVLGIHWDVSADTLQIRCNIPDRPFTKRGMLSLLHSIYDPLGFVAPVMIKPKIWLRDVKELDWDEELSDEERRRWETWIASLAALEKLSVQRCFKVLNKSIQIFELHHFADGSSTAYGAVSYLRMVDADGFAHCTFLMGKGYIAESKRTVPQLEMLAALTAVRLDQLIRKELTCPITRSYFWSDSTATLQSILSTKKKFSVFVANRLAEIERFSRKEDWRYVPTNENPADDVTKETSVKRFLEVSRWLYAPDFLWKEPVEEPTAPTSLTLSFGKLRNSNKVNTANVMPVVFTDTEPSTPTDILIRSFSSSHKLKRATVWLLRFGEYLHMKHKALDKPKLDSRIALDEIEKAGEMLIRYEQRRVHTDLFVALVDKKTIDSRVCPRSVRRFSPVLIDGLIRIKGRLKYEMEGLNIRFPVLLPADSHLTSLVVNDFHVKFGHCGLNHTFTVLRSVYWVEKPTSTIRKTLNRCVVCRRLRSLPEQQLMAELPDCRIQPHRQPFSSTGTDCFGPFMVKQGRSLVKRYGCIFTCLSSRAIHLEVLHSLSADSFLMAFDRFRSRRGQVDHLYSDNGTNFVSADKMLKQDVQKWNQLYVDKSLQKTGVAWHFNAPYASHSGGSWERLIRSVRKVLMALSPKKQFNDESLLSLFAEVELIINSRPLTPISFSEAIEKPLTPNDLLLLKPVSIATSNVPSEGDELDKKRWLQMKHLANLFWKRWIKEYLPLITPRTKWLDEKRNLQEGDIVISIDDSTPRNCWPMGRIVTTFPDKQGMVQTVMVKIDKNIVKRPISKLSLLIPIEEIQSN